jgi:hypothetical protein
MKKLTLIISLISITLLFDETLLFAQEKQVTSLKRRLAECNTNNRQLEEEIVAVQRNNNVLINKIGSIRDSLTMQVQKTTATEKSKAELQNNYNQLQTKLGSTNATLTSTQKTVEMLQYELELQQNSEIGRIYDFSIDKVKEGLIARLSEGSLGFQFDEDEVAGTIKITKAFDGNTEAWWVFDKTIDVLLEMKMQMKPHKFDANRTLVYVSTILLEKVRYSNKQYQPQDDNDKSKLYQEKALRLLETNLRKQTKK